MPTQCGSVPEQRGRFAGGADFLVVAGALCVAGSLGATRTIAHHWARKAMLTVTTSSPIRDLIESRASRDLIES